MWVAEEGLPCPTWLARAYGRNHGILLRSGTAALELALRLCVPPGGRVALPAASCPKVVRAVLDAGAVPVVVTSGADLLLTASAVAPHVRFLDAVIAIHQYGLHCDIQALHATLGKMMPIIEDSASAWGVSMPPRDMATQFAVTSLGANKPLSIGMGGALFAELSIRSPCNEDLPSVTLARLKAAVRQTNTRTHRLGRQLPELLSRLRGYGLEPWSPEGPIAPSWQFIPIRTRDPRLFRRLRYGSEADALDVCAPRILPLTQHPDFHSRIESVYGSEPVLDLHTNWVLLDPCVALEEPAQVEAWAFGGQA